MVTACAYVRYEFTLYENELSTAILHSYSTVYIATVFKAIYID